MNSTQTQSSPRNRLLGFTRDLGLVLAALPLVEICRLSRPAASSLACCRCVGSRLTPRSVQEQADLRRAVVSVDRLTPGGPDCFRRALLMSALDRASASEQVNFGIVLGGKPKAGHAWLESDPPADPGRYDTIVSI